MICRNCAGNKLRSICQQTTESMSKVRTFLDYVHMATDNQMNGKHPCVTIIKFYIIIRLNIKIYFCVSLSVKVSDSGKPLKYNIKYHTNKPCHKLHHYIPIRYTHQNKILHTPTIIHKKDFFRASLSPVPENIIRDKNVSF